MLLGIILHGVMAYQTTYSWVWPIQDPSRGKLADYLFHLIHSFRMPLFFMLSGFLSHHAYHRLGQRAFLMRRWKRLGFPMLLALITFVPLTTHLYETLNPISGAPKINLFDPEVWQRRDEIANSETLLREYAFKQDPMQTLLEIVPPPLRFLRYFTLQYLWFLYYLLVFAAVVPWLSKQTRAAMGDSFVSKVDKMLRYTLASRLAPLPLAILTFPFLFAQITIHSWGLGTPFSAILPFPFFLLGFLELNMIGYYGFFFSFGWILKRQAAPLEFLSKSGTALLSLGLVTNTVAFLLCERFIFQVKLPSFFLIKSVSLAFYALSSVAFCLGLVGCCHRLLARSNPALQYLSDASYWIYLSHLPLVVYLQHFLHPWPLPWGIKLIILSLITMSVLLLAFELLVKRSFLGTLLRGKPRIKG